MKKSMIYVLVMLVMWSIAISGFAQKQQHRSTDKLDPDATVEALKQVIYKHQDGGGINFIETEIYPKFKKDPDVLTKIGHAFDFMINDSANAFKYIERALAINPKYVPAYVEKGNILSGWAKTPQDTLDVYRWYDKAISIEPQNPLGYQAYSKMLAKQDIDAAAKKMEEILRHDPNYNVYVEIGALYTAAGTEYTQQAVESYSKADVLRMTPNQIAGYITLLQAAGATGQLGAYKRSDSLLTLALDKYPVDTRLNRLMMQNSVKMQKYDKAIAAADVLFNKSDSLIIDLDDFMSYAQAYEGLKNYNAAIEQYRKCVDFEILRKNYKSDDAFENAKRKEERQKNRAWQAIAKAYDASGYTDMAIEEQKKFIEHRREQGKLDAPEIQQLIKYYESQAEILMGEEQKAMYINAYNAWKEIAEITPDNASLAYYYRIVLAPKIDEENKDGLAVPDAEMILKLISFPMDPNIDKQSKAILETGVRYLAFFYFKKDRYIESGRYFKMLGQINPDDATYLQIMSTPALRKKMRI